MRSLLKWSVICTVLAVLFLAQRPSFLVRAQSAPGLVAAYSFSEGTGTTVADISGNGLTGTIVGATWTAAGKTGSALSFNGSSSYVDLGNPAALQLTGSMTLEAWINAAANPVDDGQIIAKSDATAGWQFKTTPDTGSQTFGLGVSASGSSNHTQRYSAAARSLNTWYHVAGVYSASSGTLSVYVNGVLSNGSLMGTIPASQFNQAVNANIGRRTGGFYFNGTIDDVRVYNRALSQSEIQTDMNTPVGGTPPPPDAVPPTVSMTAPQDGVTVAGTATLSATAADNVGIAGVQFLLDGTTVGSEDTSAPYSLAWDATTTFTGSHTLSARARDLAGNTTTSSTVSVTVTNPTAADVGQWSGNVSWPFVSVHANLLPNGKVLMYDGQGLGYNSYVWDPAANSFSFLASPNNIFCGGNAVLADGRVFSAGGHVSSHVGLKVGQIYDPVTNRWTTTPNMTYSRWYPTNTPLPDGRMIVMAGEDGCAGCNITIPEIYNPVTNSWSSLSGAPLSLPFYPHDYILPDGRLIVTSTTVAPIVSQVLNIGTQTWAAVDPTHSYDGGSSVMYLPGKFIKTGTSVNPDLNVRSSAATAYVLDMTQANPGWRQVASMAYPRAYHTMTLLPDGTVLVTGGGPTTDAVGLSNAILAAELWNPVTETWTTLSSMHAPRLYHSVALLLPDARVLVSGGGRFFGNSDPTDQVSGEIFSPPYLFKGPRPTISSAPALLNYGLSFTVQTPNAATIAKVSLIRLGSVTHDINMSQNFLPLTFTADSGSLNVTAPANANLAVPGPYMLFITDTNGVPSVAAMVRLPLPSEDAQAPTPPLNLNAFTSTGAANLTWSAATDNIGVTAYNIHRSTTNGFTPTNGNKIGQTSGTSYPDTGFSSAGTYYYVVTAQDAKGNVSTPSNQAPATIILDTTPPLVSWTSPAAGSSLSGTVTLTVSGSDDVVLAGVQFLLDGANLGAEVTGGGPNYTFSWATSSASNGAHTLSARARDGAGNTAVAGSVMVSVSNAAPSGLVAAYSFSQGSGTTVSDSSGNNLTGTIVGASWTTAGKYGNALSFNGTSSYVDLGNPAALQLTGSMTLEAWVKAAGNPGDDGQIIAKSNASGWQFKTSPDTGPHTFGLKVSPASGTSTQRYSTTVRSLNTWYHVTGVYDAAGRILSTYVNGVLDNGTLLGTVPGSQFNAGENVYIGRRTGGFYFNGVIDEVRIYNRALTQAEIQSDMNTPVGGSTPPADGVSPTVSMTGPAGGASLSGTVTVTATATDNISMGGVQFLLDGANLGTEVTGAGPGYTFSWNTTTVSNGPHVLSARARDAANNTATSASVNVTVSNVDVTPPSVSFTSPAGGATVSGVINIAVTATDNISMGGVQFLLDGANLGAEVTGAGPGYTFSWNTTTATNGTHTLAARARDAANNTATTGNVTITVSNGDTTPPVVFVTAPGAGAMVSGTVTVTATATDNVSMGGVQFLLDGANLGAEVTGAGPGYTFSWNTTTATNGAHTVAARARDGVGNTGTAGNVTIQVANTAPSGLTVAYGMNAGSGTTVADSSGNGITGTLSGATWTAGKYGNGVSFNGTSNYVNLGNPSILQGTGSMTWAAWVKATGTPSDDGQIIAKSDNSSGWQFKTSPDTGPHTFAIAVTGSGGRVQRYSTTVRALNTWYHVAGVYNATARTLDIYVNGVLDNGVLIGTVPTAQVIPTVNVNIGRRTNGFYFKGVIDEVRVYNRALSQAEIQAAMTAPLP